MRNNMRYRMLKVNSDPDVTGFERSSESVSHSLSLRYAFQQCRIAASMSRLSTLVLSLILLLSSLSGCIGDLDESQNSDSDSGDNSNNDPNDRSDNDSANSTDNQSEENLVGREIECPDGSTTVVVWGEETCAIPEVFAASDVSQDTVNLTLKWYGVGSTAWGNLGPIEIYIIGENISAAEELEDEYCERHKALDDNWKEEWDCANENYRIFTDYVEGGGAAVSAFMKSYLDYDFTMLIMSAKFPGPEEEDYKPVMLHEYFHVFQHAHIQDKCSGDSRDNCIRDEKMGGKNKPWFSEGGAEYMAQSLYAQQPGVRDNYLREVMEMKLNYSLEGYTSQDIRLDNLTYDSNVNVYDVGAWFIAFLIHNEGESTYREGFYGDLDELGFDASFEKNFNATRTTYIEDFELFLEQPREEVMAIIPEQLPVNDS